MQDAVIFDLDGTIACTKAAYEGINSPELWCWDTFRERMAVAPIIEGVAQLWNMYETHGICNLVLTARPSFLRIDTSAYLLNNKLNYTELFTMPDNFFEKQENAKKYGQSIEEVQAEYKQDALNIIKSKYNILAAFDDSRNNVEMFRDNGIPAFHLLY